MVLLFEANLVFLMLVMINTDVIVDRGGKEGGSAFGFSTGGSGIRVGDVCVCLVLLVMVEAIVIMFSLMVIMIVMVVLVVMMTVILMLVVVLVMIMMMVMVMKPGGDGGIVTGDYESFGDNDGGGITVILLLLVIMMMVAVVVVKGSGPLKE